MTSYTVYILPDAWQELKVLPGNVRQRVKRAIDGLATESRPAESKRLEIQGLEPELRRLRLERWRLDSLVFCSPAG